MVLLYRDNACAGDVPVSLFAYVDNASSTFGFKRRPRRTSRHHVLDSPLPQMFPLDIN
jgi:hypothetical protein